MISICLFQVHVWPLFHSSFSHVNIFQCVYSHFQYLDVNIWLHLWGPCTVIWQVYCYIIMLHQVFVVSVFLTMFKLPHVDQELSGVIIAETSWVTYRMSILSIPESLSERAVHTRLHKYSRSNIWNAVPQFWKTGYLKREQSTNLHTKAPKCIFRGGKHSEHNCIGEVIYLCCDNDTNGRLSCMWYWYVIFLGFSAPFANPYHSCKAHISQMSFS